MITNDWGWLTESLAVILVIASLVCLVAPKRAYYAVAAISLLAAGSILADVGTTYYLIADLTMAFNVGVFVLALIAARREARVSEQSNPMNLPVFG